MSIVNIDQALAWDGEEGDYWTDHDERHNLAVQGYQQRLMEVADIAPDETVLDVGCGCGESTRAAARAASAGTALGVDLSARMLARARELARTEGLTNVSFEHGDAQVFPFDAAAFDIAMSRFGAMFFADQEAAFTNIGNAVRPGGRLVLIGWQELAKNEWLVAIRAALAAGRELPAPPVGAPGPFGLADADQVSRVLGDAGFHGVELTDATEPFVFGTDADDAFRFVRGIGVVQGLLEGLEGAARDQALERLEATVAAHETVAGVVFDSSAWIITARRL